MFMSSDVIAAQHICIGIVSIFHVLPISLSMAFSVLVGNMIGAQRVKEAWRYIEIGLLTGATWGFIGVLIMTSMR